MSIVKRLTSATLAAWVQMLVSIIANIILVPIFLSHWDTVVYGLWIATQAFSALLRTFDLGYQIYMGREYIKTGVSDSHKLSRIVASSLPVGILIGLTEALILFIAYRYQWIERLLGATDISQDLIQQASLYLIIQSLAFCLFGSSAGLFNRAVALFGFYPRMSWWSAVSSCFSVTATALAVLTGGNILVVGLATEAALLLFNYLKIADGLRILKTCGVMLSAPDFRLGFLTLLRSAVIMVIECIGSFRRQGIRLVLSQLIGLTPLTYFSTTRTVSNLILQAANSIYWPISTELQKSLHLRDCERLESILVFMWIIACGVITPLLILIQLLAKPMFVWWTHGQIPFDPLLFCLLSISTLIYVTAHVGGGVIAGFNRLRPQIAISLISAIVLFIGLFTLVPIWGLVGAAAGILISETFSLVVGVCVASRLLSESGLRWPITSYCIVLGCVLISSSGLLIIALQPNNAYLSALLSLSAVAMLTFALILTLPSIAQARLISLLTQSSRILGLKIHTRTS